MNFCRNNPPKTAPIVFIRKRNARKAFLLNLFSRGRNRKAPNLYHAHAAFVAVVFKFDKLHRVLQNLLTRMQVFDLYGIADRAPVVLDDHIVVFAELHCEMLKELPHHGFILFQRAAFLRTLERDIVVRVRLVERVTSLEPAVVTAVPIFETRFDPVADRLFEFRVRLHCVLDHCFSPLF